VPKAIASAHATLRNKWCSQCQLLPLAAPSASAFTGPATKEPVLAPALPLLCTYPKETKSACQRCLHAQISRGTSHNSQDMELPRCLSVDDWIKKMWHMHTMEYYPARTRRESCHLQKPSTERQICTSHMEANQVDLTGAESRVLVRRGWGEQQGGTKALLDRRNENFQCCMAVMFTPIYYIYHKELEGRNWMFLNTKRWVFRMEVLITLIYRCTFYMFQIITPYPINSTAYNMWKKDLMEKEETVAVSPVCWAEEMGLRDRPDWDLDPHTIMRRPGPGSHSPWCAQALPILDCAEHPQEPQC
jgi:hypothetical protein